MIRFREKVHTAEVIQERDGFNAGFPQAAGLLLPDPHQSKSRFLQRKLVREDNFRSLFQWAHGSDHCTGRADHTCMRGFFNHASIVPGAPYLHRATHDRTPAHTVSRQVFAIVLTGALPGVYSPLDSLTRSI